MNSEELILAATDWSENARRAVQRAAYISGQRGAQGLLMHVAKHGLFSRVLRAPRSGTAIGTSFHRIEKLAQTVREQTGFSFATQIHAGDVANSIAKAAHLSGAHLIALGRWTDSALISWTDTPFQQSVALRLLNQASNPVLIVKSDPKKPYARALVAVDSTESADDCLKQAHALAPQAELILVHAMSHAQEHRSSQMPMADDALREARIQQHEATLNRMHELVESAAIAQRQVVKIAEYGYAPKLILDKEREFGVDLVVIGRSKKSSFRRLFFGGVTSQVLARSQCDVLVVPSQSIGLQADRDAGKCR